MTSRILRPPVRSTDKVSPAFLCAAVHYCFFAYLDDRIISPGFVLSTKTTTVPQAYATTVSLVLVTAFRAALVASIGTCYTQCLWATFRKPVLKAYNVQVSLIEDLFQVQTNPFHFLNYQSYFKTPVLVAISIFCWLVPIAILYPPGTLVVGIKPSSIGKSFNVSVFRHGNLLDMSGDNVIAPISCNYNCEGKTFSMGPPPFPEAAKNVSLLQDCSSARSVPTTPFFVTTLPRLYPVYAYVSKA
ncbi:hypothetical protein IG631_14408 [Alternaria alternata]|nr:hypothetical protein IG631_14408 [Alternaria alternata]